MTLRPGAATWSQFKPDSSLAQIAWSCQLEPAAVQAGIQAHLHDIFGNECGECNFSSAGSCSCFTTPGGIRTPNLWLRRPLLYPVELQALGLPVSINIDGGRGSVNSGPRGPPGGESRQTLRLAHDVPQARKTRIAAAPCKGRLRYLPALPAGMARQWSITGNTREWLARPPSRRMLP